VTLFAAGEGAPKQMLQSKTDNHGGFSLDVHARQQAPSLSGGQRPERGRRIAVGAGNSVPKKVTVNELTTVASAFTWRDSLTAK